MDVDLGAWDPLSPRDVSDVLAGLDRPWWIAGGWAIDLHVGRQTRIHADLDVLILREDQSALRETLTGWELWAADPPGSLRRWPRGEVLPRQVHDIWCRRTTTAPWCLQVMIADAEEGEWFYRRDPRIRRPVVELHGPASDAHRSVLAPEVQLLQKSNSPRPKDEADFLAVRDLLDGAQTRWLRAALALTSPQHPWLAEL